MYVMISSVSNPSVSFIYASTCDVPNDVKLTLPADSVCENGVVEISLLHV